MTAFVDELRGFAALDAADRARLVALHEILAPELPAIAGAFEAEVRADPTTAALVSSVDHGARVRTILIDWMASGLLGPYDDPFVANRSRIAHHCVAYGLGQQYLVAAINLIRRAYRSRIAQAYAAGEAHAVCNAIDKLLDIELVVMVRHYQLDAEDKVVVGARQRRFEQVEAMQTLCAGLAHEVRNPLNSAKLQLELAVRRLRRDGDDPRLVEPIELAGHEINRLTTLLDEFLAFARPRALDLRRQDVTAVVREVVERGRAAAHRRGAELTLVDSEPIVVEIDAAKVGQIVENLVCNAVEAVTAGGHVTIAVVPVDGHVHIRVTDDGTGIPSGVLPRIYEPFYSTKEGGTGMGMSIVHSLVALHRGTIEVASSPRGTTFDVALSSGGAA